MDQLSNRAIDITLATSSYLIGRWRDVSSERERVREVPIVERGFLQ